MAEQQLVVLRQDWLDFLDADGLRRWAGWPSLDEVLVKELADNAADAAATEYSVRLEAGVLIVENDGPDLPMAPEELFTIKRPLTSSKVWRCAGRGALGNGARVVAGIVASHGGTISVESAGLRTTLDFDDHGNTIVLERTDVGRTAGTRIKITPMDRLPISATVVEEPPALVRARAGLRRSPEPELVRCRRDALALSRIAKRDRQSSGDASSTSDRARFPTTSGCSEPCSATMPTASCRACGPPH